MADSDQPVPSAWERLDCKSKSVCDIAPGEGVIIFLGFALFLAFPAALMGLTPSWLQRSLGGIPEPAAWAAFAGGVLFIITIFVYRAHRIFKQLTANERLASVPPEDFVLYLRSFRRSGHVVVRNGMESLVDRDLLGPWWDLELNLSIALAEKISLVAVGSKITSLGAAKFITSDSDWQFLVADLMQRARAIVIVPDDRQGTLWELQRILEIRTLREKTLIIMPPEQYGWRRRILGLPRIETSWNAVRQALPTLALPDYDPIGAHLLFDEEVYVWRKIPLRSMDLDQSRNLLASIILGESMDDYQTREKPEKTKNWLEIADPLFWVILIGCIITLRYWAPAGAIDTEIVLVASSVSLMFTYLHVSFSYTKERPVCDQEPDSTLKRKIQLLKSRYFRNMTAPTAALNTPHTVATSRNLALLVSSVLVLRSFLIEPFQIPSSSMVPTLEVGDYILVNKLIYGIRLPAVRTKVFDINEPRRGDVVVFFPPHMNDTYYIKRVIGLPGDSVSYRNKRLFVNGEPVPTQSLAVVPQAQARVELGLETLGAEPHLMQDDLMRPGRDFTLVVEPGHYFMMGDNRDNSSDSRVWGQVPEQDIVGKVIAIWMNWDELLSIPSFSRAGAVK